MNRIERIVQRFSGYDLTIPGSMSWSQIIEAAIRERFGIRENK